MMIRNYFKIAWRNLIKNKLYTIINLFGLTTALICFILIALYIQFELSYESHQQNVDNVYRVVQQQRGNEFKGTDYFAVTPRPLGIAMKKDFPEVEAVTNIYCEDILLVNGDKSFSEKALYADEHVFDVFTIPVIQGSGKMALKDPSTVLLTQSLARKIFGKVSPLDKEVLLNNKQKVIVKGVVADPPKNQHFTYDFITSIQQLSYYEEGLTQWDSNNYYTYFALSKNANYKTLEDKMVSYEKITKPIYESSGLKFYPQYSIQPLKDIHLYSNTNFELEVNGSIKYVYFFIAIAIIILILAAVNYTNLATAQMAQRAKEVGVSKILGARKTHLASLFLGESFLLTLFSLVLAFAIVILILPAYNGLLDKDISLSIIGDSWLFIGLLFIAVLIGVSSGIYPALYLSNATPVVALKGKILKNKNKGFVLRNALVVGQFVVAIILIVSSVIIYQQHQFTQNANLGYNRQSIVHVPYSEKVIAEKEQVIKEKLLAHPKIHKVSLSSQIPLNSENQGIVDVWEGNTTKDQMYAYRLHADYEFLELFEMELLEGRGFSKDYATDPREAYILNESALKQLGWETAVGKTFEYGKVIGVVKDFHLQTFDQPIEPLFINMNTWQYQRNQGEIILKITPENFTDTKHFIETTLSEITPHVPYEVSFMDDTYAQLYTSEIKLGKLFNIFSALALFIAGMGLFGLVSFQVVQRTKEIGIRKVLGLSVSGVVGLLSKDFLKLVLVALIIATPIAYFSINKWLQNYVYRIEIDWWVFILVGLSAIGVAFITISIQSIKAAIANPIKSLRTE